MTRFAVIAGGGTAGHVHPGLAVAREFVDRGRRRDEILYVGSERGIEHDLVPTAGFELVTVAGRGIPRSASIAAARAGGSLVKGIAQAIGILRRERPKVILSLGGFAAVPCSVAARVLGIPVVIHEQNAVPGAANRLISKWAKECAVSFAGTPLPRATVTGNPVRAEMLAVDRSTQRRDARTNLGVADGRQLVVVTGGSLGALSLNEAAIDAGQRWRDRADICLRHIVGERDWDMLTERRTAVSGAIQYQPIRYESDMPSVFAAADVVVSRAGASTTAELAAVGVPSVLVPLPGAPGDHQTANARALVDAGGALLVPDAELDGASLTSAVEDLLASPNRLDNMSISARTVGRRDAASRVADVMESQAK